MKRSFIFIESMDVFRSGTERLNQQERERNLMEERSSSGTKRVFWLENELKYSHL